MAVTQQATFISYTGDGATVAFSFPYYFIDKDDLVVTVENSSNTAITQVRPTDYDVSGTLSNGVYPSGGTVTFVTAPTSARNVFITRRTAKTQPAVYNEGDLFPAKAHEHALDRLLLLIQELSGGGFLGVLAGPPNTGTYNTSNWFIVTPFTAGGIFGYCYTASGWKPFAGISE